MPIKRRRCVCGTIPIFNIPAEKKGVCCAKCKTGEMIDVVNRRCSCGKISPVFNVPGEVSGVCCKTCKTDDMVDVKNKRCMCGKSQPSFNEPGEAIGVYCSECKINGMVNVVTKRRCLCGKIPTFNVLGEISGVCCKTCKTGDMIDVAHHKCLCGNRPSFNISENSTGVCCAKCRTDDMIDVTNKVCPGYNGECPVRTRISNGHEYCMSCDPNDARRKLFKRYEEEFFDYVKDKLDVHQREFRVTFDPSETAKKYARVDGIIFGDGVIVCLEVDENSHHDYECDEHRMHLVTAELLQKYPDHIVSWVRVNPTTDEKSQWG